MSLKRGQLQQLYTLTYGARRIARLQSACNRLQRRLERSMAHIRQPRAGDLERWRGWETEIEEMKHALAAMRAEGETDAER